MPYKSLPLGAFWTIFGRNFPTGVPELLYPYQPANPLVESIFKALIKNNKNSKNSALYLGDGAEEIPGDAVGHQCISYGLLGCPRLSWAR